MDGIDYFLLLQGIRVPEIITSLLEELGASQGKYVRLVKLNLRLLTIKSI